MGYFIYLRKSRKDMELEAELGDTLIRHRQKLLELARTMKLNITKIYEEVVSGETIAQRPQIQQMLSDIETCGCEGVLVMEIERLARGDTVDQGIIARTFSITNTKIITPSKIYDPSNEFDREYFEFGLFMSRREYQTIQRRIQQGRIQSIKEGRYISSRPPYGYERVKIEHGKGYTLKPLHPECDAVRLIFDLYVNGKNGESYGSHKIAGELDRLGYHTRTGVSWSAASVRDILHNITYAGYVRWGYRKTERIIKDGEVIKKTASKPSEDGIVAKGMHEAIIDLDTFNKVQQLMKLAPQFSTPINTVLQNPLSGLVYCAKCGNLMTRLGSSGRNKYSALKCPNRHCNNVSAPIILIEDEIITFLRKWIKKQELALSREIKDNSEETLQSMMKSKSSLQKSLNEAEEQLNSTYTLLEKGIYSEEVFLKRQRIIDSDIKKYRNNIDSVNKEIKNITSHMKRRTQWLPHKTNLLNAYCNAASASEKNEIMRELIEKVYYSKDVANTRGKALARNFKLQIIPKIK